MELYPGAHLAVSRGLYTHHGIYAGDDYVLHKDFGPVRLDTLAYFARGRAAKIVPAAAGDFAPAIVLARALSRLGEKTRYCPLRDNCEHFVTWCRNGKAESTQVKRGLRAAGVGFAARNIFPVHPLAGLGIAAVAGIGAYFLLDDDDRKQALADGLNTGAIFAEAARRILDAVQKRPA